jgi:serine/threonine protein kinase
MNKIYINVKGFLSRFFCSHHRLVQEFKIAVGDVIAERYTVTKHIGSAAFSRVVAAADGHANNELVCLKIIRANKDFFDQSLDEIKLLQIANEADPNERGIVRLRHFFYWREHLVIVTELLYLNLYQCLRRSTDAHEAFFSLTRIRSISQQVRSCLWLRPLLLLSVQPLVSKHVLEDELHRLLCQPTASDKSCLTIRLVHACLNVPNATEAKSVR